MQVFAVTVCPSSLVCAAPKSRLIKWLTSLALLSLQEP